MAAGLGLLAQAFVFITNVLIYILKNYMKIGKILKQQHLSVNIWIEKFLLHGWPSGLLRWV